MQIQLHALKLVQGLTGSPQGAVKLSEQTDQLVPALFQLIGREKSLATPALVTLVNLAQEPVVQNKLLSLKAPARCMDYLKEKTCPGNENLLIMLLANLTAAEEGARQLLQIGQGAVEGLNLAILLGYFLAPFQGEDAYEHVASILPNATVFEEGRKTLLQPGRGTLQALASQLESKNPLRREGCAGAIKNCCFSCDLDGTAELIAEEDKALDKILDVLCTRDKADEAVRLSIAEAVLCLAKSDITRKKLWEINAVEMLKKGYEDEEHPVICECLEAAAEFFLQDGFNPEVTQIEETKTD